MIIIGVAQHAAESEDQQPDGRQDPVADDVRQSAIDTENLARKAIQEGVDPQEAYIRYGRF